MANKANKANEEIEVNENKAGSLEEFLLNNPVDLVDEVKISDRIPFTFKIKAMDADLYEALQKRYTKTYRKGKITYDSMGFNIGMIIESCVSPNFKAADFVKKAGVISPEEAVKKLLRPGEIINLATFIQELSGFDKDTEELKDEVKNS
ncbi:MULTISPECIES: phage tail assembly chaperone [Erysipelotrichaceae]|uniref:XkdN-like protein n=1 Tax=[Eubacterium] hominis TaxID=2764325 RepID=A0A7G9GNM2_9FIRM|nr:XkdN-like protein [Absiella sp. AM27-20]QNM12404.1 XkdN-like protein [[Eubacterium] hominis]RHU10649.1 XkdN-like protein [Absiella sp. AM27-20]